MSQCCCLKESKLKPLNCWKKVHFIKSCSFVCAHHFVYIFTRWFSHVWLSFDLWLCLYCMEHNINSSDISILFVPLLFKTDLMGVHFGERENPCSDFLFAKQHHPLLVTRETGPLCRLLCCKCSNGSLSVLKSRQDKLLPHLNKTCLTISSFDIFIYSRCTIRI